MTNGTTNQPIPEIMPTKTLVGIVVALPEELTTLTKTRLALGESIRLNEQCLLIYAGAGAINAERAANTLLAKNVNALLSWGCAAALSPALKSGDLVMPAQIISENESIFDADAGWLHTLSEKLNPKRAVNSGSLLESSVIIASGREKQAMFQQSGAVALDMESAAIFKVAHQAGLPCLAIRTIADTALMDLPAAVASALDSQGKVDLVKLLTSILLKPQQIPALIRLGLHFHAAQKTLKQLSQQLNVVVDFQNDNAW